MNEDKNNSKQYSAEDIQRYLKGQMSAQEMHALETAALEDPFLADAIEGFEAAIAEGKEESIKAGLTDLNRQVEERVKPSRKIVPITSGRWWQFSAAALILVITGVAFYSNWIKPEQKKNALAVHKQRQNDSATFPKIEGERSAAAATALDTQNNQEKKSTPAPTLSSAEIPSSPPKTIIENERDQKLLSDDKPGNAKVENKKDDLATNVTEQLERPKEDINKPVVAEQDSRSRQKVTASASNPDLYAQRNNQLSPSLSTFSGQVVDSENKPLSNASLHILSNNTRLVTDQAGNFNFTNKDSVVNVQVDMVGFEQRNFRLQNSIASNKLILEPVKQQLDEVVVTGYGSNRKKDVTKTNIKVQDAVPQIGWAEYEKYLEKNKRPPTDNPLMTGEVVLSFVVKRYGGLSDFKIEKSLSDDHDAEAIRLIKEGPAWKLLKGWKSRITVIVKF